MCKAMPRKIWQEAATWEGGYSGARRSSPSYTESCLEQERVWSHWRCSGSRHQGISYGLLFYKLLCVGNGFGLSLTCIWLGVGSGLNCPVCNPSATSHTVWCSVFSFPLLSPVLSVSPGEGNIWMSLITKLSSKPVLTHWNQLCHSGLKIEEGASVPNWTASWKMYLWSSLLHQLSCKLSRTNYPLHLWTANNSSPNSCQYRPLWFFPLQIFHLQQRHWTRSRDSATANIWSCV